MHKYKLDAVMNILYGTERILKELLETEVTLAGIIDDLSPEECKELYEQCDVVEKLMQKF